MMRQIPEPVFVTLYETPILQELEEIKLLLSNHDFPYRVLYENSLKTGNAMLLGSRGAVVEVLDRDYELARLVLTELNIDLRYDTKSDQFSFIYKARTFLRHIPLIRKISPELQIILLYAVGVLLLVSVLYLLKTWVNY